jgi:MoxR-like ATPase
VSRDEVVEAREAIRHDVYVHEAVKTCLVDFAGELRADRRCQQGASTRALVQSIPALQARAALCGRDFINADDISALAPHIFAHRLTLIPGVRDPHKVIQDALKKPLEILAYSSVQPQ